MKKVGFYFIFHLYKITVLPGFNLAVELVLHAQDRVLTKDQLYTCHNIVPLPAVVAIWRKWKLLVYFIQTTVLLARRWKHYFLENLIFSNTLFKKNKPKPPKKLSFSKIGDSPSFPITALWISTSSIKEKPPQKVTGWLAWRLARHFPLGFWMVGLLWCSMCFVMQLFWWFASQLRRATISNPITGALETAHYRISKR